MKTAFRLTLFLAALPVLASAQTMRGLTEIPTDTVRRGLFFELGGPGELYSVMYEHHLRPATVAQIGFTRWSFHFLSPRHATRAGIMTLFRQVSAPELFSEYAFAEFGGGLVGGQHITEEYDPLADPAPGSDPPMITRKSPWLALTGLVGVRLQPINGGLTYRLGITPMIVLRDLPQNSRWAQLNFGMSLGYTW